MELDPTHRLPSGSEPADFELTEAREALDRKQISPLELIESCLQRIEAIDDDLKAWVTLDEARATELALELTNDVSAGRSRGALHGIPVGVKDIIDVAGLPTTAGSRVLRGNVAERDALVVRRLREAGAVILGKTNTQEFAYGVVTPPTRNPWDPDRIPGGSSGGSAVAVASGMCLGALGTDTGGSIRIPSSLCGISGLKPRNGALPMDGIVPLSPTLDCCGPMARTADDLAMLWNALSDEKVQLRRAEGMRLGVVEELSSVLTGDDRVGTALDRAVTEFEKLGLELVGVNLPPFTEWDGPRTLLLMSEALAVHQEAGWYPRHTADYTEETRENLRSAESINVASVDTARRHLQRLQERFMQAFEVVDVLVLPSTSIPAPRVDDVDSIEDAGARSGIVMAMTRVNGPINWCGAASVSVCCGFTEDGLPMGMQLVARDEVTALSAAAAYQRETDFHKARPPLR